MDATGIDRIIASCGELERALEAGPSGWDQPHYHQRLMLVTRHRLDEYPHNAGPIPRASARLLAANNAEFAERPCFDYGHCVVIFPLPEEERAAAVELLKRAVAEKVARLRELRADDARPGRVVRCAVAAAYCDGSEEGKLRHRYEMAIDRSLRATIQQLIALEKSGADLAEPESYPNDSKVDTSETPAKAESPAAAAPGSVLRTGAQVDPDPARNANQGPKAPESRPACAAGAVRGDEITIRKYQTGRPRPGLRPGVRGPDQPTTQSGQSRRTASFAARASRAKARISGRRRPSRRRGRG